MPKRTELSLSGRLTLTREVATAAGLTLLWLETDAAWPQRDNHVPAKTSLAHQRTGRISLSKVTPHSPVPEGPGKNISLSPFGYISHRAAEKFPSRIARNGCSRNPNIPQ